MGWCDDPKSKKYNQLIKLPSKFSYEKLYRKDNIYDLVLPIDFNTKKIIRGKGSAIFIHVARKNFNENLKNGRTRPAVSGQEKRGFL